MPIDPRDADEKEHLQELIVSLEQIIDHNAFEEAVLFPLICARGSGELASLLTQEHVTIGPLTTHLRTIAAEILQHGISAARWREFRLAATEFVSEMMLHVQEEELTVVQRLASFIDADVDHRLALRHRAERRRHGSRLPSSRRRRSATATQIQTNAAAPAAATS